MNWLELIGLLVTALVMPYLVALIKQGTLTGSKARWLAVGISLAAGVIVALAAGIPTTPTAWITCILAAVGAVQMAYATFKSVGITSEWLDALSGIAKDADDPLIIAKNTALADKAEERVAKHAKDE